MESAFTTPLPNWVFSTVMGVAAFFVVLITRMMVKIAYNWVDQKGKPPAAPGDCPFHCSAISGMSPEIANIKNRFLDKYLHQDDHRKDQTQIMDKMDELKTEMNEFKTDITKSLHGMELKIIGIGDEKKN